MAGKEGGPKYNPEQMNKFRATRALYDAHAIKNGAVYVEDGRLEFTRIQLVTRTLDYMISSANLPEVMQKEVWAASLDNLKHTLNLIKMRREMVKETEPKTQPNLGGVRKKIDQRKIREIEKKSRISSSLQRGKPEYHSSS